MKNSFDVTAAKDLLDLVVKKRLGRKAEKDPVLRIAALENLMTVSLQDQLNNYYELQKKELIQAMERIRARKKAVKARSSYDSQNEDSAKRPPKE